MKNKLLTIIGISLIVSVLAGCFSSTVDVVPQKSDEKQSVKMETSEPKTSAPKTPISKPQSTKEFTLTAKQWSFSPSTITVNKGDKVVLHVKSTDVTHGFQLDAFGISKSLSPGKTVDVQFTADKAGTFSFFCNVFCGSGHGDMKGALIVK